MLSFLPMPCVSLLLITYPFHLKRPMFPAPLFLTKKYNIHPSIHPFGQSLTPEWCSHVPHHQVSAASRHSRPPHFLVGSLGYAPRPSLDLSTVGSLERPSVRGQPWVHQANGWLWKDRQGCS